MYKRQSPDPSFSYVGSNPLVQKVRDLSTGHTGTFDFEEGGAKGASGYLGILKQVKHSIYVTHLDGDGPSENVMKEYDRLLQNRAFAFERLIFFQKPLNKRRYGWIEEFEKNEDGTKKDFPGNFAQRYVPSLPNQNDVNEVCSSVSDLFKGTDTSFQQKEWDTLKNALLGMRPTQFSFAVFDHQHENAVTANFDASRSDRAQLV